MTSGAGITPSPSQETPRMAAVSGGEAMVRTKLRAAASKESNSALPQERRQAHVLAVDRKHCGRDVGPRRFKCGLRLPHHAHQVRELRVAGTLRRTDEQAHPDLLVLQVMVHRVARGTP